MKKKLISVILCVSMVAAMVVGCGTKEEKKTDDTKTEEGTDKSEKSGDLNIEIVSKGFQHQFWQAVLQGAEEAAKEAGATINFVGPNTESDIADQVQMLNNAINKKPAAIGLAALDTEACLDGIKKAQSEGIPIVGFDSGVPGAPEGAIVANASTDNYKAGELAAENLYPEIKDKVAKGGVRIGVMGQDATSESIVNRGLGFIDKIAELVKADGKTVSVEGNDKYVTDSKAEKTSGADVVIDVAVPSAVTAEASAIDGQNLMNKADTIAIYASNQHSGEALVNANSNLKKLGKDGTIVGVAFDSGKVIKGAVEDGTLFGAVTQDPLSIGRKTVELCVAAAKGEKVEDVDTGAQWYNADNMKDDDIAPNLYD
ncbi:substrate-binding domain-containing protein [Lachnospiraceae bacterium LCP25S3_G4]